MRKNGEKGKHLTSVQRKEIELGLNAGMTFKEIAKRIGKDPTTVSYEAKHHRFAHKNGFTAGTLKVSSELYFLALSQNILKLISKCNAKEKKPHLLIPKTLLKF